MTNIENKLKLRETEVIHAETFELACKVCELADKLGRVRASQGLYLDAINWVDYKVKTCYNLSKGEFSPTTYYENEGYTIISAIEWLNRHNIFVFGQEVMTCSGTNLYIAPRVCVAPGDNEKFRQGKPFATAVWTNVISPFPVWPPEPTKVRFVLGDKETMISAESAEAIKEILK